MAPVSGELVSFTHQISPFCQRVTIAFKEKEIPYKAIFVDLPNKPQGLLDANPVWKKVPAITHGGNSVSESTVIIDYLEDAFPDTVALLPKDALARSKARFWGDYVLKGYASLISGLRAKPGSPEKLAAIEAGPKFFKTLDEGMTSFSKDGPFFTGDKFGYVDVLLATIVSWLLVIEKLIGVTIPGPEEIPRFHKWVKATSEHKSVSDTVASNEETLEFYRELLKKN